MFPKGILRLFLLISACPIVLAALLTCCATSPAIAQEDEYKLAYDSYKAGNLEKAEKEIEGAIKKAPDSHKYFFLKGLITTRLKRNKEAIAAFLKCKSLKPNDFVSMFNLGSLYDKEKDYSKSAEAFEEGLVYRPNDYQGNYKLAKVYMRLRKYKKAAEALKKVAKKGESRFEYNYLYGLALRQLKQYKKAIARLESAHKLNPGHTQALIDLADAYQRNNDYAKAASSIETVLAKQPGNVKALQTLGDAKLGEGDYEAALANAEKIIAQAPTDYEGYLIRAEAYKNLKQSKKAIADFKKVLEIDKGEQCAAATHLAAILYAQRDYAEASEYYSQAYKCNRSWRPLLMIAHCHYRLAHYDDALLTYQKVLRFNPSNEDAKQGAKSSQEHIDRKNKKKAKSQ